MRSQPRRHAAGARLLAAPHGGARRHVLPMQRSHHGRDLLEIGVHAGRRRRPAVLRSRSRVPVS